MSLTSTPIPCLLQQVCAYFYTSEGQSIIKQCLVVQCTSQKLARRFFGHRVLERIEQVTYKLSLIRCYKGVALPVMPFHLPSPQVSTTWENSSISFSPIDENSSFDKGNPSTIVSLTPTSYILPSTPSIRYAPLLDQILQKNASLEIASPVTIHYDTFLHPQFVDACLDSSSSFTTSAICVSIMGPIIGVHVFNNLEDKVGPPGESNVRFKRAIRTPIWMDDYI
ncbi:hypothetical protein VNO78_28752 [Psophocarpus tetragonolobus]|uniref:Uncharacterized protein n=1 Tax=Psophocarpus tetragonolobus TaxID=3891 RepID=A0AAN9WZ61_PSOTE